LGFKGSGSRVLELEVLNFVGTNIGISPDNQFLIKIELELEFG
jgi:hypothetical protein